MWIDHWGFATDPFASPDSTYVSLPSHDEAVARLVYTIEAAGRLVIFNAPAGMGKTTVLREVLKQTRNPRRTFATITCPPDGTLLFAMLAERLGNRLGREPGRLNSWRAMDQSIRAASLQGTHVVLAIDDCQQLTTDTARRDFDLLVHLGAHANAGLTIVQVSRSDPDRPIESADSWMLAVGLEPLTRSEAECYLTSKLRAVGCTEPIFTPRAITRLHALSRGVPQGIEQLATLSLMAAAVRGLEIVPPDVVDGVSSQVVATR